MDGIDPITMPGVHRRFLDFFLGRAEPREQKVLDLGAGRGAFTRELYALGYDVYACDLFPEIFRFDEVKCEKCDITDSLPFADDFFDLVIGIEVSEHIIDHETFFSEISRILKPGGRLYISTPNILSMKSRMRFLFRGFPYGFKTLERNNYDGLQHVASLSLDQYNYIAVKNNFHEAEYDIDRIQGTSRILLCLFYPFLFLNSLIKKVDGVHNSSKLLLGRLLFMVFRNNKGE